MAKRLKVGEAQKQEPVKARQAPVRAWVESADFVVTGGGSLYLLTPKTPAAVAWVEEHIGQDNGFQPYWPTVTVEHRYIADIVRGARGDGLVVR